MDKWCPDCDTTKDISGFYKNKARKDGHQSVCKPCIQVRNKKWYAENTEHHNKWMSDYAKNNRGLYNARDSKRRASELRATPEWANQEQIKRVYTLCKKISDKTGVVHHVDHVIPLQGKNVCGLHVERNLAIIPAKMNIAKGNKYDPAPSPNGEQTTNGNVIGE